MVLLYLVVLQYFMYQRNLQVIFLRVLNCSLMSVPLHTIVMLLQKQNCKAYTLLAEDARQVQIEQNCFFCCGLQYLNL